MGDALYVFFYGTRFRVNKIDNLPDKPRIKDLQSKHNPSDLWRFAAASIAE